MDTTEIWPMNRTSGGNGKERWYEKTRAYLFGCTALGKLFTDVCVW